jgi:hypothetical protein
VTSVLVIVGIFFILGITVGVITVIAMSAVRRDRRAGPGDWPGHGPDGPEEQPPDLDRDSTMDDERPWWRSRDGE